MAVPVQASGTGAIPAAPQAPEQSQSAPPSAPKTRGKVQRALDFWSLPQSDAVSIAAGVRAKASLTEHPTERVKEPPNPSGAAGGGEEADGTRARQVSIIAGDSRDHSRDTRLFPRDGEAPTSVFRFLR